MSKRRAVILAVTIDDRSQAAAAQAYGVSEATVSISTIRRRFSPPASSHQAPGSDLARPTSASRPTCPTSAGSPPSPTDASPTAPTLRVSPGSKTTSATPSVTAHTPVTGDVVVDTFRVTGPTRPSHIGADQQRPRRHHPVLRGTRRPQPPRVQPRVLQTEEVTPTCPALTTGLPSTRPTLATSSSAMFVERGLERPRRDVHAVSSHVNLAKRSLQNAGQVLVSARTRNADFLLPGRTCERPAWACW